MKLEQAIQQFLNDKTGSKLPLTGNLLDMTKAAMLDYINKRFKELNFLALDGIIAIRTTNQFSNKMNDILVVYKGGKVLDILPGTTVPGHYYVYNPLTVGGITGAAVVVANKQYKASHVFVTKESRYYDNRWNGSYFYPISNLEMYRDANKNNILDATKVYPCPPSIGICIHPMGENEEYVWNWSAGCFGAVKSKYTQKINPHFKNGEQIALTVLQA